MATAPLPPSFLQSLPVEIFRMILEQCTEGTKLSSVAHLRLVSKPFDYEFQRQMVENDLFRENWHPLLPKCMPNVVVAYLIRQVSRDPDEDGKVGNHLIQTIRDTAEDLIKTFPDPDLNLDKCIESLCQATLLSSDRIGLDRLLNLHDSKDGPETLTLGAIRLVPRTGGLKVRIPRNGPWLPQRTKHENLLVAAACMGLTQEVAVLLKKGIKDNATYFGTAVTAAIRNNDNETAFALFPRRKYMDIRWKAIFKAAAWAGNTEVLKELYKKTPLFNTKKGCCIPVTATLDGLTTAAGRGHENVIQLMLQNDPHVLSGALDEYLEVYFVKKGKDKLHSILLAHAVWSGQMATAIPRFEYDIDVKMQASIGPASHGKLEFALKRFDNNIVDTNPKHVGTVFYVFRQAVREGYLEIAELFIKHGYFDKRNQCDDVLLNTVAKRGWTEMARLLSEHGVPVNTPHYPHSGKKCALYYAIARGHVDMVQLLLLEKGCALPNAATMHLWLNESGKYRKDSRISDLVAEARERIAVANIADLVEEARKDMAVMKDDTEMDTSGF
ncbi:ankyrin [Microthyrium microscopicum]|uniref:Ankyrin n=1 Tax=Microthyrium microscopicum TaxID=703497 RepID=A0A6A6UBB8_9PEZI|nr:ankyrin [Microthyrium microscopicum]